MNYDFSDTIPHRPVDYLPPLKVPRQSAISMRVCVRCAGEAEVFADPLSEREYNISGLCQKCQDWFFSED